MTPSILCGTGLLYNSQTFVGVLVSILTLCVLISDKGDSNLLNKLIGYSLDLHIEKIKQRLGISNRAPKPSLTDEEIKNNREKLRRFCAENYNNKKEGSIKAAFDLQIRISKEAIIRLYMLQFINTDLPSITKAREEVVKIEMTSRAAFYFLLYGIIAFIFDEIIILFGNVKIHWGNDPELYSIADVVFSILTMLTILTIIYWGIIWIATAYSHNLLQIKKHESSHDNKESGNQSGNSKEPTTGTIITILFLLFIVIISLAGIIIPQNPTAQRIFVYGISIAVPICFIIRIMMKYANHEYASYHGIVQNHLFIFLGISIGWIAIIFGFQILGQGKWDLVLSYGPMQENLLIFLIEFNILFFGLILPYWIPIRLFHSIIADKQEWLDRELSNNLIIKDLDEDIQRFVRSI